MAIREEDKVKSISPCSATHAICRHPVFQCSVLFSMACLLKKDLPCESFRVFHICHQSIDGLVLSEAALEEAHYQEEESSQAPIS